MFDECLCLNCKGKVKDNINNNVNTNDKDNDNVNVNDNDNVNANINDIDNLVREPASQVLMIMLIREGTESVACQTASQISAIVIIMRLSIIEVVNLIHEVASPTISLLRLMIVFNHG